MSSVTCCPSTTFLIVSLMANVNFLIVSSGSKSLFFKSSMAFPAIFLVFSSLSSMTSVSLIQRQNKALVVMVNCLDNDNNNNNNNNFFFFFRIIITITLLKISQLIKKLL